MLPKSVRRPLGVLGQIILFLAIFLGVRAFVQRGIAHGEAPAIAGITLDGKKISLDTMRGQPVLVHFWATWCAVCKREQGSIASLSADYPVISIVTQSGGPAGVARYLSQYHLDFPVLIDQDGKIAAQYGVRVLPTSFFVDSEGRIRFVETGYTSEIGLRVRRWLTDNFRI